MIKPIVVTSGEPAGIGPDLCLALADLDLPVVVVGDEALLRERAQLLGKDIQFHDYSPKCLSAPGHLTILPITCVVPSVPGVLNPENAEYVLNLLNVAANACLQGEFSALVTAPIHKAVINEAGFSLTGHTEFLADFFQVARVVMMLVSDAMRVALVTTHLPLKQVPDAITPTSIIEVIQQLDQSLKSYFCIQHPKIFVAGLNPHAGESGYFGREEIDVIQPALAALRQQGLDVAGPFPADTMFSPQNAAQCDAFVAMYHDQGLSVLKYASFGQAVNVTLGLPIIRTSVDHGTALDLAGTHHASPRSLIQAVKLAAKMAGLKIRQRP